MSKKLNDLTGQIFNGIIVVKRNGSTPISGNATWECKCPLCGEIFTTTASNLQRQKSCNCFRKPNLIGQRFGKLVVIEDLDEKVSYSDTRVLLCKCDCGTLKKATASGLKNGHTKQCTKCSKFGNTRQEAGILVKYACYKTESIRRGRSFNLSLDQFTSLISGNCHYCGSEPSNKAKNQHGANITYNGIDRVVNNIDYEPDNCVSCCKFCNYMKRTYKAEQFLAHINKIYTHQKTLNT